MFDDYLYWSDWNLREVIRCDKWTGKNETVLKKTIQLPNDLRVSSPSHVILCIYWNIPHIFDNVYVILLRRFRSFFDEIQLFVRIRRPFSGPHSLLPRVKGCHLSGDSPTSSAGLPQPLRHGQRRLLTSVPDWRRRKRLLLRLS